MALIGTIRKNSWILVVMIALGVGGFIVMDIMTTSKGPGPGGNRASIGKINGKKVNLQEFDKTWDIMYGNSGNDAYATRQAMWQFYVEEAIISGESDALGLGVSPTELQDLQFGPRPSRIISQRFSDPNNPGQVNREQLNFIKQIIEENRVQEAITNGQLLPTFIPYWNHQKKEIITDRLQEKLTNLVSKALYTPTWMAEMGAQEQSESSTFAYVKVGFDEIDNADVTLSDSDYAAFLKENEAKYKRDEEGRRVEYVVFDIIPSAADSAASHDKIADLIQEFQTTDDDSSFVLRNEGTIDAAFVKKSELSPLVADTIMKLSKGSVFGPYLEDKAYKAVKLLDRKMVPDSVRSRHILRQASNPMELAQAHKTIDSLKVLIETGQQSFDSLAMAFGTDGTRTKGGDLDYAGPGQMVKPFNDLIFYQAEQGKLYTVETQFGVHLVEVTGKKFIKNDEAVQVAYIKEDVVPSDETQSGVYEKASTFAYSNRKLTQMEEAVKGSTELSVATSTPLDPNAYLIGELGTSGDGREIVKWAYGAKKGEVSSTVYAFRDPVAYYNNKYVVVGLKDIEKAGLPSVESIKADIEQLVINRKKAELIKNKIKGQDMKTIAATYQTTIDTAYNINFAQGSVPDLGTEPAVLGTVFTLTDGQTSQPITGETGVFVVNIVKRNPLGDLTALIPSVRQRLNSTAVSLVSPSAVVIGLRKTSKIKDNRSKYF